MNPLVRITHLCRARPLPVTLVACTSLLGVFGGYDGLSSASLAWLGRVQKLAAALNTPSLQIFQDALASPNPHIDLIAALWTRLLPITDLGLSLTLLTSLATLIAITSLWRIVERQTGEDSLAASIASLHFVMLPAIVNAIRGPSATMIALALWLVLWDIATLDGRRWWQMMLGVAAGGLLLGSWSSMVLWACFLILAHLGAHPQVRLPSQRGLLAPATIPAFILLCVPLVPLAMVLTHPGLWQGTLEGILRPLEAAWLHYPFAREGLSYAGAWHEQGKLSLLESGALYFEALPFASCLLMLAGTLHALRARVENVHTTLLLYTLPFIALALWAMPGQSDYGALSQVTLSLAVGSMLVGCGVSWCARHLALATAKPRLRWAFFAAALLPPFLATVSFYRTPALWKSSLTGGAQSSASQGDDFNRHTVLSRGLLLEAIETHDVRALYVGDLWPLLHDMELPDQVRWTQDVARADGVLWRAPRFAKGAKERPDIALEEGYTTHLIGRAGAPLFVLSVRER